jgi:hypothetical protein
MKDSYVPDPSLTKVLKDSILTILPVSDQFVAVICGSKGVVLGAFCRTGAHCLGEKSLLGLEDLGSVVDLIA